MDKVEARLKRIEGQVAGIRRMYREERECMEIAQQIAAARSALANVGRKILSGEAVRCAVSEKEKGKFEKLIGELFSLS